MKANDVRLLIVDDEPDVLECLSDLFRAFGFQTDCASDGEQAWQMISTNSYRLVLTDIRMPKKNGVELVKLIREKHPLYPTILLISGYTDVSTEEMFAIGVDGFFSKPFDASAVRNAIQQSLLKPQVKWSHPETTEPQLVVDKKAKSIAEIESSQEIIFGHGGLFISHKSSHVRVGWKVQFKIEIQEREPFCFEGAGIVRWTSRSDDANTKQGFGLEFTSLNLIQVERYVVNFTNRTSFIPSPKFKLRKS